jgi:ABC-type transport system involved in multi-copper enzyme maturation permease subunit
VNQESISLIAPGKRAPAGWLGCANRSLSVIAALLSLRHAAVWPMAGRELRGMSRQGQVFWIRVVGGGLAIATLAFLLFQEVQVGASLGGRIFHALNSCLIFTIILVGPVITADCIAQEKREGTLGLLFLAPLKPSDIVIAKALSNALRAFTLLLAVVPMMALPVVFGGVPAIALVSSMILQMVALCIALSAGILASTLHRQFIEAAVWAVIYCIAFAFSFRVIQTLVWPILSLTTGIFGPLAGLAWPLILFCWGGIITFFALRFASRTLKRRWEKEASNFKPPAWVKLFSSSELWQAILKWDTQKARSAHPIAWLQEYSWTARLAKWGWCALALIGEFIAIVQSVAVNRYHPGHLLLSAAVTLGIALAGANSFRTERLTGAMELLLVTPISTIQLIGGRLWGIWVHFFPAVAIIGFCWISAAPLVAGSRAEALLLFCAYLFVPMIGLYLSMFPWNVLVAWAAIYLIGAVIPFAIGIFFRHELQMVERIVLTVIIQAFLGLSALALLHRKLRQRNFTFQKGES